MKKQFLNIVLALVLMLLTGCQGGNSLAQSQPVVHTPEGTEVCLKILAENSQDLYDFRMGKVLDMLIEEYSASHPGVTFEVEYLPCEEKDADEREMRIEQLRYEILTGKGPDIYLMTNFDYAYYKYDLRREPMFTDVNMAMRNGAFLDISAYYNADDALIKEELKQEVMDAGTFGNARYVLPMAYDMMVCYVDEDLAAQYGLDLGSVPPTAENLQNAIYDAMIRTGEGGYRFCLGWDDLLGLYPFGQILDYDSSEVLLKEDALVDWLRKNLEINVMWRQPKAKGASDQFTYTGLNFATYYNSVDLTNPFLIDTAGSSFEYAIINQIIPQNYDTYALRSNDGTVTAKVAWWGAVGSGCDYADVAYGFLREFLTRETQWDLQRPDQYSEENLRPFCWDGIPVRTEGLVEPMLERYKLCYGTEEVLAVEMTDEDFPILAEKIDHVLFDSSYEREYRAMAGEWFDIKKGRFKEVDIDQFAADYIRDLEFFLAES